MTPNRTIVFEIYGWTLFESRVRCLFETFFEREGIL